MLRLTLLISLFFFKTTVLAFESVATFDDNKSPFKVLLFLSKDCPCSRSHVAHLNKIRETFKDVAFYGVIADEIREENRTFIEEYFSGKNFNFPIIKDEEQKLVKEYGALKTPHVSLLKLQPNKKYTRIYEGGVSDHRDFDHSKAHFLQANLVAVTAGKPLPYSNGKSLGCYIRRL
jgi:hypothetical protein